MLLLQEVLVEMHLPSCSSHTYPQIPDAFKGARGGGRGGNKNRDGIDKPGKFRERLAISVWLAHVKF